MHLKGLRFKKINKSKNILLLLYYQLKVIIYHTSSTYLIIRTGSFKSNTKQLTSLREFSSYSRQQFAFFVPFSKEEASKSIQKELKKQYILLIFFFSSCSSVPILHLSCNC